MSAHRFRVTSVTGYSGNGGNHSRLATVWQVLDTALCYRIVAEYKGPTRGGSSRERAEQLAARLNAEHGSGSGDTAPMPLLDSLYRRLSAGDRAA